MARKILYGSLVLTPIALIAHYVFHVSETTTFMLAALALMPLAWLIGEATEHVAEHTGPGIGGFFNASFGNAPELIIALLAVHNGLPDVVRGSIIGSVVSNLLLVLGLTMFFGVDGEVDRRSLFLQLALVGVAIARVLRPVGSRLGRRSRPARPVPRHDPRRDRAAARALHRRHDLQPPPSTAPSTTPSAAAAAWSMRRALVVLGIATVATAFVAEISSARSRSSAHQVGLSEFFVAIVIVAIVGNAAEHGGAIVVATRGKIKLATEIAVSSAAQVAVFVAPAAALLVGARRQGPAARLPAGRARDDGRRDARRRPARHGRDVADAGRAPCSSRVYVACVAAYWIAGDR